MLFRSVSQSRYLRLNPTHYWPLTDPADPNDYVNFQAADYGSDPRPLVTVGTSIKIANADGLAEGLPNTSLYMQANNNQIVAFTKPTAGAALQSFSVWHSLFPNKTTLIGLAAEGAVVTVSYTATTSLLQIDTSTYSGTTRIYQATIALDTNVAHLFTVLSNADATIASVYVDGLPITVSLTASGTSGTVPNDIVAFVEGAHQQCALWRGTHITATQIETIYRLSRNIFTETTAARMNRIMGFTSFPGTQVSPPSSPVASVGAFTTGGPSIATELEVVSDSEGGNLYVTKNGTVKMTSRNDFAAGNSLTSQATIGTTGITIGTSLEYRIDADLMRNQLAIGYSGSGSIEVSDSTSVTAYGVSGGSITTH